MKQVSLGMNSSLAKKPKHKLVEHMHKVVL